MYTIKKIKIDDGNYPKQLLSIKKPPKLLYAIGNIELLQNDCLAIVGSRNCTSYGENIAKEFASKLSEKNITIVSGLAAGIDTAAHIGAKNNLGKTIAVLGGGFNNIFPEENIELFNDIINKGGCIISEYSPSTKPNAKTFPERNRIVNGLSKGVLVVEAAYRSGSSITAKMAIEENRLLFAIPGNIDSSASVGTNRLIKNGAILTNDVNDILFELGYELEEKEENIDNTVMAVEKEYQNIFNILKKKPIHISEIVKSSKENISEVNQKLFMLELQGYIKSLPGNEYVRL